MTGQQLLRLRILWAALTASALLTGLVGYAQIGAKSFADFDASKLLPSFAGDIGPVQLTFLLAIVVAVFSLISPKFGAQKRNRDKSGVPVFPRAFPPFIMGLAMCEACALFGVIDVVNRQAPPERALTHAAIAAVFLIAFHFPTERRVLSLVGGIV
jgi:hypothetical protein